MKKWIWNKRDRVYIDSNGDELTEREIRQGLDDYIESIQEGMDSKVAELIVGTITIATLFQFLDEEISAMHGAAGAIVYGGLEQMGPIEWARVDQRLQVERMYLRQFKEDVDRAAISGDLAAEGIAGRAGLYAEAAYAEYVNQIVEREQDEGITLGRRVCEEDGASCQECVDAATEEFIPLDDIPPIGSLQCMNNCRCEIEFSVGGVEFATSDIFQGVVGGSTEVLN